MSRLGALQERQFRLLWLGQTTSAIGDSVIYVALPFAVIVIALGSALFAAGIVFGNAIWETLQQREIPQERLSRVNSFDWMVSLIFMPVGQVLAGPLSDVVGVESVLIGVAR